MAKQRNGTLRVEYRRKKRGEGRWYATGKAQLQSCKRTVREAALRGLVWEVDLRASYPMIVLGLMKDMARTCEKTEQMEAKSDAETEQMEEVEAVVGVVGVRSMSFTNSRWRSWVRATH